VLIWHGVCGEGLTAPMISDNETLDAERYINDVLSIALKSGNKMLGNSYTCREDGARPHTHNLTMEVFVL
jgi:hypothetical protein